MTETLNTLLKISLVIFMAGNLLEMAQQLQLGTALVGLRNARFVSFSHGDTFPRRAMTRNRAIDIKESRWGFAGLGAHRAGAAGFGSPGGQSSGD